MTIVPPPGAAPGKLTSQSPPPRRSTVAPGAIQLVIPACVVNASHTASSEAGTTTSQSMRFGSSLVTTCTEPRSKVAVVFANAGAPNVTETSNASERLMRRMILLRLEHRAEIDAKVRDRLVERLRRAMRRRLHDAALHDGEDERCQRGEIGAAAQTKLRELRGDRVAPRSEVRVDQDACAFRNRPDLEREAPDRAAVFERGRHQAFTVIGEDGEDALEWVAFAPKWRVEDVRDQCRLIRLEHRDQDVLFVFKEMIEAAAPDAGPLDDVGATRRLVTAFPKQLHRGTDDPVPGRRWCRHTVALVCQSTKSLRAVAGACAVPPAALEVAHRARRKKRSRLVPKAQPATNEVL